MRPKMSLQLISHREILVACDTARELKETFPKASPYFLGTLISYR